MSSEENETEDQSELAETAQSDNDNGTKEDQTEPTQDPYATTQEETDISDELEPEDEVEPEEEICKDEDSSKSELTSSLTPFDLISKIYNNPYYWAVLKSTMLFLLALKMARESKMLRIPMKEYRPFNRPYF